MVKAIQADRIGASHVVQIAELGQAFVRGDYDDHPYVQAFARHRIEAAAQARREAIEEAAAKADSIGEAYGEDETGWFECSETIARAIRSLLPEGSANEL